MKLCYKCHKQFKPLSPTQRYCSSKCKPTIKTCGLGDEGISNYKLHLPADAANHLSDDLITEPFSTETGCYTPLDFEDK